MLLPGLARLAVKPALGGIVPGVIEAITTIENVGATGAVELIVIAVPAQHVVEVAADDLLDRGERISCGVTGIADGVGEIHREPGRGIEVVRGVVAGAAIEDVSPALAAERSCSIRRR